MMPLADDPTQYMLSGPFLTASAADTPSHQPTGPTGPTVGGSRFEAGIINKVIVMGRPTGAVRRVGMTAWPQ